MRFVRTLVLVGLLTLSLSPAVAAERLHGAARPTAAAAPSPADIDIDRVARALIDGFDSIAGSDGELSSNDLEAASGSSDLGRAAAYLRAHPPLAEVIARSRLVRPSTTILRDDLRTFRELNADLLALAPVYDTVDTATGGTADGTISVADLRAAAKMDGMPKDSLRRLADDPDRWWTIDTGRGRFSRSSYVSRIVNGHAALRSPQAAYEFVDRLDVPSKGRTGLDQRLFGADGVLALHDAAMAHAGGDLSKQQRVISHLPETDDGTRNRLITAFYATAAIRADRLFGVTGHRLAPGANWLDFAPWASAGVFNAIDGKESVYGVFKLSAAGRQGASDGNQWIFNDITRRFVRFVRLYERTGGHPDPSDLEAFFEKEFVDGDEEIRHGFLLYAAALDESDPAERQRLMFMGNVQVAVHEQAGVDPYLSKLATGPDAQASRYIELVMGRPEAGEDARAPINVQHDLKPSKHPAALQDAPIFELAPSNRPADQLMDDLGIQLDELTGWSDVASPVELEPLEWFKRRGEYRTHAAFFWTATLPDPDASLRGTGVGSWPDFSDRMWFLYRLFEQFHVDPSLRQLDDPPLLRVSYDLTACFPDDDVPDEAAFDLGRATEPSLPGSPTVRAELSQGPGSSSVAMFECNPGSAYSYGLVGLVDAGSKEPIALRSPIAFVGGLGWISDPPPVGAPADPAAHWHQALRLTPYEVIWQSTPAHLEPGGYHQFDVYGVRGDRVVATASYVYDRASDDDTSVRRSRDACAAVAKAAGRTSTVGYYVLERADGAFVAVEYAPDGRVFDVKDRRLVERRDVPTGAELRGTLNVLRPGDSRVPFCQTSLAWAASRANGAPDHLTTRRTSGGRSGPTAPSAELRSVLDSVGDPVDAPIADGCDPRSDELPDGEYFGFVPVRSIAARSIRFDLACYRSAARVEAGGQEAMQEDNVENVSDKLRTLTLAESLVVWRLNDRDGRLGTPCTSSEPAATGWSDGYCRSSRVPAVRSQGGVVPVVVVVRAGEVVEVAEFWLS